MATAKAIWLFIALLPTAGGQSFFYYRPSAQPTINFNTIPLGTIGDKPLLGDFDGDNRLDPAVFRPSTAVWIVLKSSVNQITQTTLGLSTDVPVPADYDGDGITNIAVFRPSNGFWYTSQNPATNFGAIQFGADGDRLIMTAMGDPPPQFSDRQMERGFSTEQ